MRWQAWDLQKRLFQGLCKGDPDVIAVGAAALRWQFITFPLGSWIVMSNMMLQTIRKPVKATIISSARQEVILVLYSTDFYSASLSGVAGCGNVSGCCWPSYVHSCHTVDMQCTEWNETKAGGTVVNQNRYPTVKKRSWILCRFSINFIAKALSSGSFYLYHFQQYLTVVEAV